MLNTDLVIDFLKKNGQSNFEKIWKAIKNDVISSLSINLDEITIKTDLHLSMTEDQRIIMTGQNKWDLYDSYSHEETIEINKKVLGEELEKASELDSETKELKLEINEILEIKEEN